MTNHKTSANETANHLKAVKVYIVTLVLAITVGLWSIFSKQYKNNESFPKAITNVSAPTQSGLGYGLPPIPTLVPPANNPAYTLQNQDNNQLTAFLRQVMIQQPSIQSGPITRTGSSR